MTWFVRTLRGLFLFSAVTALIVFGQNCTVYRSVPVREMGGTGGFDGKVYTTYGPCSGDRIAVANKIAVTHDLKNAAFTRENCQDLFTPKDIDVTQLKFPQSNTSILQMGSQVYNQQT